jgi:predicted enzyme related to lactoylglutathione lyase
MENEPWRKILIGLPVLAGRAAPYFLVDDVVATTHFYREKLGFGFERVWGDPPCFNIVWRDGASIMFSQVESAGVMRPNCVAYPERSAWDAYFWIDDADALHHELAGKGVPITRAICNQMYRCRDFEIRDYNGHTLCFGLNMNS